MTALRSISARRPNRVRLGVQTLEARDVPATTVIDLSAAGATGTANGALLQQTGPVAPADFHTFLKLDATGTEEGYNTDARPFQLDQTGTRAVTHSLKLADVPTVTVGGTVYRQFMLDVQEPGRRSQVTLDELRIFLAESGNLTGYNSRTKTLAGRTAAFDLDAAGNMSVRLNAGLNTTAKGDAFVLIPNSLFGNSTYVYLYSKFGGRIEANGGAEEWGVLATGGGGGGGTASLSGTVFADLNGNGIFDTTDPLAPDVGVQLITVQLQRLVGGVWTVVATQQTDGSGHFAFNNLDAGTYAITKQNDFNPAEFFDGQNTVGSAGGTDENPGIGDTGLPDTIDGIVLGTGVSGTGYNFGLLQNLGG